MTLSAVGLLLFGRIFGPILIVPSMSVILAMTMATDPLVIRRPWIGIALSVATLLVPLALELGGVNERTFAIEHGAIALRSAVVRYDDWRVLALVVTAVVGTTAAASLYSRALAKSRREARRAVAIQAWHLRKMLPIAAPTARVVERGC